MSAGMLILSLISLLILTGCIKSDIENTGLLAGTHLRQDNEVLFYLNREANDVTETAVRDTFRRWGEATHFNFIYAGRNRAGLRKDRKNTVSFLLNWPSDIPPGKVAYCMNWFDRKGNIIESDIILNMSLAKFTTLYTNTADSYYIEGVLAHEIGHLIGLGHIDSQGSLMKKLSPMSESYFLGRIDAETMRLYTSLYPEKTSKR
jgi:hypothetical protein